MSPHPTATDDDFAARLAEHNGKRTLPDGLTIPAKPDAAFLSRVLRDRSLWPEGFEWSYFDHRSCAIGLAARLWPEMKLLSYGKFGRLMGMSDNDAGAVFFCVNHSLQKSMGDVTPTDVANALDAAIAGAAK